MSDINALITSIFTDFTVDGVDIPVCYMRYNGHDTAYVTWMQMSCDASLTADDDLQGYVGFYDFDIYSKGNYTRIIEELKQKLKENGFVWQVARSSPDMFEDDTGYYHKTLNFAIFEEV